jgi:transcriptional regulator with GAF, ATPase, and Fis domain
VDLWVQRVVLATTRAASELQLCHLLVSAIVRPNVVLARVWLTTAAGADGHLRLLSSAGTPTGGGSYNRVDGAFSRISLGDGKIGQIAASRQPLIVRGIRGDEGWLANPSWIARQGVRTFAGYPLLADADLIGVLAVFDRWLLSEDAIGDLQFIAHYAAARIADLRERVSEPAAAPVSAQSPDLGEDLKIVTRAELRDMEKATIVNALARSRGKVFGADGAAALLGMKPTTLASRMKALGLSRADFR